MTKKREQIMVNASCLVMSLAAAFLIPPRVEVLSAIICVSAGWCLRDLAKAVLS